MQLYADPCRTPDKSSAALCYSWNFYAVLLLSGRREREREATCFHASGPNILALVCKGLPFLFTLLMDDAAGRYYSSDKMTDC
jgi:hypothetical protein